MIITLTFGWGILSAGCLGLALLVLGRYHVCGLAGGYDVLAVFGSPTGAVLQIHPVGGGGWLEVALLAAGTGVNSAIGGVVKLLWWLALCSSR